MGRAVPRRAARPRRRRRRARGPLRAARERRARVHRGAPAPPAAAAGRADPARRARLLGRARSPTRSTPRRPPSTAPCSAPTGRSTSASPSRASRPRWRALGDERLRALVDRYVRAWERGDVDAVVAMLADDATLTMPPRPTWYRGRDAVAELPQDVPARGRHALAARPRRRQRPARVRALLLGRRTQRFLPHGVNVLTLRGDRIADITTFLTPGAFARFELPAALA